MTPNEAVTQAMDNHEFRGYQYTTLNTSERVEAVMGVCWCGAHTPPFLTEQAARDAHGKHRDRAALMRSFGEGGVVVKRSDGTDVPLTDKQVEIRNDGSIRTTVAWIE